MPVISEKAIIEAFARVEETLLLSMMRNLKRHRVQEALEGFEWEQWQSIQLTELSRYVRKNLASQGSEFARLNSLVDTLLTNSYRAGLGRMEAFKLRLMKLGIDLAERARAFFGIGGDAGVLGVPDERLDALVGAVRNDLVRAEYATLRKAEDIYKQVIFDAQVYATSGAGTYESAIDMAVKDFLARGVRGITYRDGSRHSIREYAQMAVRTAVKRAALVSEGKMRQEWGVHTIIVNPRANACPVCMRWVGQILVDDVYSGGTFQEAEESGYPLLSDAMAEGLFHPNCEDTATTYFPGITVVPPRPTQEELDEAVAREKTEGELSNARSRERAYSRIAEMSLDESTVREAEKKAGEAKAEAERIEDSLEES